LQVGKIGVAKDRLFWCNVASVTLKRASSPEMSRRIEYMNTKMNRSYHRIFFGIVAIVSCGLIPLSASAQTSQDKAADLVATDVGPAATVFIPKPPTPAPPSSYSWKGGYVGGHVGYGWGRANTNFNALPTAAQFINLAPTTVKLDPKGILAGGQGGYNWQSGKFVAGVEADISWSRMRGTAVVVGLTQNNGLSWNGNLRTHQDTKWFGTLRPRAGFTPTGKVLLYGTGGLAIGRVNYSANADFRPQGPIQYPAAISKTRSGWVAGGGVEVGINKHWSWKAEYLYYDLGNQSITGNPTPANPPFQVAYTWQTRAYTFNAGVNFRF
jgi:outer membrane immunogenic protein